MANNPQTRDLVVNGVNHEGISPQNTGSTPDTNHNDRSGYVVSPQNTGALESTNGGASPPQKHVDAYQGIEVVQYPPQPSYTEKVAGSLNANVPQQPQQQPYYDPPKRMEVPQHQGVGIEMEGSQPPLGTKTQQRYLMAIPLSTLQQGSGPVDCPICGHRELTSIEFVTGGMTHLVALVFCACLCLGCIPYMATWFKDVEHKCGKCGTLLAVWHRSGGTEVMVAPQSGPYATPKA